MSGEFEHPFALASLADDYARLLTSRFDFIRDDTFLPAGADRLDRPGFERQRDQHLRAIERKVTQDRWSFSPFLEREVEKTGGGTRTISLSTIRDTLVQRALYGYLYNRIDARLTDACTAYRRGVGAHDAVVRVQRAMTSGLTQILDADIVKFFDNLDHSILTRFIDQLQIDPRARRLLLEYVSVPRVLEGDRQVADQGRHRRYRRTPRTRGLPQGGVLSGMLANLYLAEFDRTMANGPWRLVRYADDFVICCSTRGDAEVVKARAEAELNALHLELHGEPKTSLRLARDGVEFVGFIIQPDRLRAREANVAKFKDRIRDVIDRQRTRWNPTDDLESLVRRLNFKIEGPVEQVRMLIDVGQEGHPYRRSWIGYFRHVDTQQVRLMDHWVRGQVSRYMWSRHRVKTTATAMRAAGLRTLCRTMWKARARVHGGKQPGADTSTPRPLVVDGVEEAIATAPNAGRGEVHDPQPG